jgi:hypothetical protein
LLLCSTNLFLWAKCVLRELSPVKVKRKGTGHIKRLKEYLSTHLLVLFTGIIFKEASSRKWPGAEMEN